MAPLPPSTYPLLLIAHALSGSTWIKTDLIVVPLHAFVLILMNRHTHRLYTAYSAWYVLGTIASMQVPFVEFLPVRTSEHMAALGVFGLVQLVGFVDVVRRMVPGKQFKMLLGMFVVLAFTLASAALVILTFNGWIAPWTGRFYSLWDTGYAKIHSEFIRNCRTKGPFLRLSPLRSRLAGNKLARPDT